MCKTFWIIVLGLNFIGHTGLALEIDTKFTARLLSHSSSKKTILLNKGEEDGLKLGKHAKFSTADGVFARAVVIKTAPSRSVWSIYRFYQKEKIKNNLALTIKIASPVKLTEDESRNLGHFAKDTFREDKPRELSPAEKKVKKELIKHETVGTSASNGVDFSTLEDNRLPAKKDPDIDFSKLDSLGGKSGSEYVDFSSLK